MDFLDKHIADILHLYFKEDIKEEFDKRRSNEEYSNEKLDEMIDVYLDSMDPICYGKIIELIIGIILLIPPILGAVAFTLNMFDLGGDFATMEHLSTSWTGYGESMSSAPIFLGLMALAGVYLLKDNIKYVLFLNKKKK